jgi:hypothetical protein
MTGAELVGDVVPLFGASNGAAKNKKIKIHHGLRWPPIDDLLCNNQPKTGFHDGGGYEGEARRARDAGEALCHGIIS